MPVARTAFGITYYSYSLHDWRQLRSVRDIPRAHWSILARTPNNYEPRNRIDHRGGAIPQRGGVDHIGAGFEDRIGIDTGAELLNEYGLNPGNRRASWNAGNDSDSICLLAPPDTRPWQHGVVGSPYDLNSWAIGREDGILSPDWRRLPADKATAHLRMAAAFWALFFGDPQLGWVMKYTATPEGVWDHIRRGQSWGLTQHGIVDPANRTDAGLVWQGGRRINTFDYDRLFAMIREEQKIRTGGQVSTPNLPAARPEVTRLQAALNELGHNLDLDGSYGDLTTTAARETAADTGYTGDLTDVAKLTTHLEDTVSKILDAIDGLPHKTADAVTRVWINDPQDRTYEAEGRRQRRVRLGDMIYLNGHRGSHTNGRMAVLEAQVSGLQAAVESLAAQQGLDPEQIQQAMDTALTAAFERLKVDATLVVAQGDPDDDGTL